MQYLLSNRPLMSALVAWALAQLIKVALFFVLERQVNWRRLVDTGGLPSSHSAFVTALAASVGFVEGVGSTAFAMSSVFASVVMYDAVSLRREAGKHADILNELLLLSTIKGAVREREALKELLGHTPVEVLAGFALGLVVALFVTFLNSLPPIAG